MAEFGLIDHVDNRVEVLADTVVEFARDLALFLFLHLPHRFRELLEMSLPIANAREKFALLPQHIVDTCLQLRALGRVR